MAGITGFIVELSEDQAVIITVDRVRRPIARKMLPAIVHIGDVVVSIDSRRYVVDPELTELRRRECRRMTESYLE